MTKRAYLTPHERIAMREAQHGLCGCGCGKPLGKDFIGEHVWILVAWGNEEKPDALWRKDCAADKTKRDLKAHARVRRLAGLTGQRKRRLERKARGVTLLKSNPKIAKRPFQKPPPGYSPWPKKKVKP